MKQKILISLAIVAVFALAFFTYRSKQTVYNEDDVIGNSSGNLFNGGLFCEYEDKIYFSNPSDEGRLYVMDADLSNFKKLSSDTATSINVAGKYIIYGRHNDQQKDTNENVFSTSNTGLYRMDINGHNTKTLFDSVVNVVNLSGNTVFFQHNTKTGFGISKIDIDKTNDADVMDDPIFPYAIANQKLYFSGVKKDHNIYRTDLNSGSTDTIYEGNTSFVTEQNDTLYFLDLAGGHSLCQMDLDGSNLETLVEEPTSTYNVTPDNSYLYYEVDNGTDNGIYRMNLKTKETKCIKEGNFNSIHTTKNFTFFQSFDTASYFVVQNKDDSLPIAFVPEVD